MILCLSVLLFLAGDPQPNRHAGDAPQISFFPRGEVRLLDGPFLDVQRRDTTYLLAIDPDRLLHSFRLNAGLPSAAKALGGWEAPDVELRGHTLGHYLSACSLMYESTGDERLKARAEGIVAALQEVQRALEEQGANAGYLAAFPESFFDRLERREGVWAPYYTIHKLLAGLLDVHEATNSAPALDLAKGIARWVSLRASRLDDGQWQSLLETEFGGMQEALEGLYRVTGDPGHLRLARLFDHRAVFDPLERGEDRLDGLHANTQIPKAIGAAVDCQLTGDPRYCSVSKTFWDNVALRRSYVIGGHSEDEHFSPVAHLSRHLGTMTAETCNTYNMLKLTRLLFERDGEAARLDFYERALFNHILASQDPATGMVTYHVALKPGAFRTYATPENSFWCCVGTGLESPARFGEAIYARQGDALLVNLFIASTVEWRAKGLLLRQDTRFPDEDHTRLLFRLDKPRRLALRVRRPVWAERGLSLSVNGRPEQRTSRPGRFVTVEREWHDGDVVDVELPMSLHLQAMPDDPSVVALLFGPIVLAADLGDGGLDESRRYGRQAPEMIDGETPEIPTLVAESSQEALARIVPTADPLVFRTSGLARPADVLLKPFFRLADRRYTVYFDRLSEDGWAARAAQAGDEAKRLAALGARTLDRVVPGDLKDEAAHALQEKNSEAGHSEGRSSRQVFWGSGEFSYSLAVVPGKPATLGFSCWGGESRHHTYDVVVDGEVISTEHLFDDDPGRVLRVEVPIPEHLTEGRDRIRVGFRPSGANGSIGAIFEVRTLRPVSR